MSLDAELEVGVVLHKLYDFAERRFRGWLDCGFARVEEDSVDGDVAAFFEFVFER